MSAWTAKANKRVLFGYGLNYLIDLKHAVIVDVEATPARLGNTGRSCDTAAVFFCSTATSSRLDELTDGGFDRGLGARRGPEFDTSIIDMKIYSPFG